MDGVLGRSICGSDSPKFYICHSGHEHDRTYTENLVSYLTQQGVHCEILQLNTSDQWVKLEQCLENRPSAVLGFNSNLDHCWAASDRFLIEAQARGVSIIQWILD